MKKFSKKREAQERRKGALSRLETQLKLGKKKYKATLEEAMEAMDTPDNIITLKERDKKRINKEIEILKSRLN